MANNLIAQKLRMPAEWEPHEATYLAWPHNEQTWPGRRLKKIERYYLDLIELILRYEKLYLLIPGKTVEERVNRFIKEQTGCYYPISYITEPYNDVWIRDYGPMQVQSTVGKPHIIDWKYNAWGGKYPPFDADQQVAQALGSRFGIEILQPGLTLEGGAIDVNGAGDLLTTRSVLLNPNRNAGVSITEWERQFSNYLGADTIIWLDGRGLRGDDTDGHIDNIARFTSSDRIVVTRATKTVRKKYPTLENNYQQLKRHQSMFTLIEVPLPQVSSKIPTIDGNNDLPASYVNFYVLNGAVIVPTFNESCDDKALALFEQLFPERDIHPLYSRDLVWGQGGIHCVTQQVPG